MRRYDLQSGLWMSVIAVLILGGLYVAADLNATNKPLNALNIEGGFYSDTGPGFALDKMSGRSTKIVAGSNANATVTIDLIPNGGAGNQSDDGVTSGTVSGQGTKIAVEVFAKGVTTPLQGMAINFDFDASVLTFVKVENSAFLFAIPDSTGGNFAATAPVTLATSGFIGRAEFTTAVDVTGRAFTLGIQSVTLAESSTLRDVITTTDVISFNATSSPDFDGDGTVGFSDFLAFAGQYGTRQGDGQYEARYDLDSDGAISFSDFLIFASSFGQQVPPSGGGGSGGSPDLIVESPSVNDNTLTTGQSFTLRATVRNSGTGRSASTTLRYYRSSDSRISTSDTQVGTDSVSGLSASDTSAESISLNAPSSAGTYYYGACVESVSGESNTNNNCSSAVRVTVSRTTSGFAPADQQAFNRLVVGKRIDAETYFLDFESAGRVLEGFDRHPGGYTYSNTAANTGTLTQNYDAGLFGGRCTYQLTFTSTTTGTLSYTCANGLTGGAERWQLSNLTTPIFARANADTLVFAFLDTWSAGQTRAYDFQFRKKMPQESWDEGCVAYPNSSNNSVTAYAIVYRTGTEPNTTYEMRYRYRNSSSCNTGSPGSWSAIVEGTTPGTGSGGGSGGGGGGGGSPDLIVESPSVSDNTLTTGQSFTLSATVRNQGNGSSASTTLRYYQSSNSTISTSDTQVGTDSVSGLSASGTSAESISLTAPPSAGTYYYGACVNSVTGESDTGNNCSTGVRVTVSSSSTGGGGGGGSQTCTVGLMLNPGDGCSGSGYSLRNDSGVLVVDGNIGGIRMGNSRFDNDSVNLNRLHLTRSGNVWTIVSLP